MRVNSGSGVLEKLDALGFHLRRELLVRSDGLAEAVLRNRRLVELPREEGQPHRLSLLEDLRDQLVGKRNGLAGVFEQARLFIPSRAFGRIKILAISRVANPHDLRCAIEVDEAERAGTHRVILKFLTVEIHGFFRHRIREWLRQIVKELRATLQQLDLDRVTVQRLEALNALGVVNLPRLRAFITPLIQPHHFAVKNPEAGRERLGIGKTLPRVDEIFCRQLAAFAVRILEAGIVLKEGALLEMESVGLPVRAHLRHRFGQRWLHDEWTLEIVVSHESFVGVADLLARIDVVRLSRIQALDLRFRPKMKRVGRIVLRFGATREAASQGAEK